MGATALHGKKFSRQRPKSTGHAMKKPWKSPGSNLRHQIGWLIGSTALYRLSQIAIYIVDWVGGVHQSITGGRNTEQKEEKDRIQSLLKWGLTTKMVLNIWQGKWSWIHRDNFTISLHYSEFHGSKTDQFRSPETSSRAMKTWNFLCAKRQNKKTNYRASRCNFEGHGFDLCLVLTHFS